MHHPLLQEMMGEVRDPKEVSSYSKDTSETVAANQFYSDVYQARNGDVWSPTYLD